MSSKVVWTIVIVAILAVSVSRLLYVMGVSDFDMVLWVRSFLQ